MYKFYYKYFVQPRGCMAKFLLTMKLTTLLLFTAFLQVSASSFAQKITLSEKNAPIRQIFEQIRAQTGYDFVVTKSILKNARPVSINVKNIELADVLETIFDQQPLDYQISNQSVLVKLKATSLTDKTLDLLMGIFKNIDVSGVVRGEDGLPLPGATIRVKGTSISAITDDKGAFQLRNVAENASLIVTFLGYKVKEVPVNQTGRLVINMEILSSDLSTVEIVNTGYQSLPKERSAGSFAKADMNIVSNRSGTMNVLQRLDGLIPGLTVNPAPGRDPLLVRGATSIGVPNAVVGYFTGTSRAPLVVVDGIPIADVNSINPQDVQDITVLKDATAASIWGSRAANGVIVIITKKGTTNSKTRINYDGFINFQGRPDLDYKQLLNGQQFIQTSKELFNSPNYLTSYPWTTVSVYAPGRGAVPPHELFQYGYNQAGLPITAAQAARGLDSLSNLDNRRQISDLWYRNAALMNHTLSLSGGGAVHTFYGSAAYTNTQSNRPGEKNNGYKIDLRQDFKINKALQFYLITDLTQNNTSAKRNMDVDYRFNTYQLFQDANGNNLSMPYLKTATEPTRIDFENRSKISLDYNPLNEVNYGYTKNDGLTARINGGATLKIYKGLRFEGVYGYLKSNSRTTDYDDAKSYAVRSELVSFTVAPVGATAPTYYLPSTGARYTVTTANLRNWTVRNQLIYDEAFGKHQITALAGQEAQEQFSVANMTRVRGFNELLQTIGAVNYTAVTNLAGTLMPTTGTNSVMGNDSFSTNETTTRFTSYYANLAYSYDRKYSVNASWRNDQSNLFGLDKSAQNKPVWSVGAKWLITNEGFMSGLDWLESLALRATYGLTGNAPNPGVASSQNIISPSSSPFFPLGVGAKISTPGNAALSWESTKTTNLGLDFTVLKGRLSGTIDVYKKKTDDLLGLVPTNSLAGYPTVIGNLGDMTNKGIEIGLNTVNIQGRDFGWNSSFVLGYNKNVINRLALITPITTGAQKVATSYLQGFPAFALFAYKYAGLDAVGDPRIQLADGTITKTNNIAKAEDVIYMGSLQPIWNGGFSNNFRYKNFGLYANMIYSLGHVMRRDRQLFYYGQLRTDVSVDFLNRWKNPGDENKTDIPSYIANSSTSTTTRSTDYFTNGDVNVVSASYVKLRDITLSYELPKSIVHLIRAEGVSFRAQLSNVMLWKANKFDIDPEFQSAMPANQHTITLGAHVSF